MTGRATDESCISRERGEHVAGAAALGRRQQVQTDAPLSREDVVTGKDDLEPLRKRNQEFTEKFLQDKRVIAVAKDLLQAREDGLASFDGLVRQQVRDTSVAYAGADDLAIGADVAVLLKIMLAEAKKRKAAGGAANPDFAIMSLYRPGDGDKSPHRQKRAIDISRYAGHLLHISNPSEVSEGVTQFYRDLAAHTSEINFDYGFGLPRNLRTDDESIVLELSGYYGSIHGAIYAKSLGRNLSAEQCGPKLNEEIRKKYKYVDVFFQHHLRPGYSPNGVVEADIRDLIWSGLTADWTKIRQQGGKRLKTLFPDEVDHLHVQILK
jgi:hypothetical protein